MANNDKQINLIIAGVGGQGIVLMSKLIAAAASAKGLNIRTAETIGMAQRGGSVFSHIRIGKDVYSPLVSKGKADLVIALEPAEAVRVEGYLKNGGEMVVFDEPVIPATSYSGAGNTYAVSEVLEYIKNRYPNATIVQKAKLPEDIHPKTINVAMLYIAAMKGLLPFTAAELRAAAESTINPKYLNMNIQTMDACEQNGFKGTII